jgi:hypothetical protein
MFDNNPPNTRFRQYLQAFCITKIVAVLTRTNSVPCAIMLSMSTTRVHHFKSDPNVKLWVPCRKLGLRFVSFVLSVVRNQLRGENSYTLANRPRAWQTVSMQNQSKPSKTPGAKTEEAANRARANQFSDQRRRDMATRSTLSRLRNRKSNLK